MAADYSFRPNEVPPGRNDGKSEPALNPAEFASLPGETHQAYDQAVGNLEICYSMMSVALDEAFYQRERCELVRARAQAGVAAELARRLEGHMLRLLYWLRKCGSQIQWRGGLKKSEPPLGASEFRHAAGHDAVRAEDLFRWLMWTERLRYMQELRALQAAVKETTKSFHLNALDIAEGTCVQPRECWQELNKLHGDLNTCIGRAEGLLRFVLEALPPEHLSPLLRELSEYSEAAIRPEIELAPDTLSAPTLRAST
jgi:hypothetical protein